MNKNPIGIMDSGIGGISVLNKIRKLLPQENYIFYADSIHNPYGNKTKEELEKIVDEIMTQFLKRQVKLVVVACNTATCQVISYLREKYPQILFVGTEPAIKVSFDHYREKSTLVMATPGTIQSDRLMELDHTYHQKSRILLSCDGLAEIIENQELETLPTYFENLLKPIDCKKIEVVVLGCTHYPLIKEEIEKAIGHKVIFIDGSDGISKRVRQLLVENNLKNPQITQGKLSFVLTNPNTKKVIEKYLEF